MLYPTDPVENHRFRLEESFKINIVLDVSLVDQEQHFSWNGIGWDSMGWNRIE